MARPRPAPAAPVRSFPARHQAWIVPALLALHAVLVLWVARENSVTFDENFHVPAGVRILRAADFATSYAQPPLPKTLYAAAALLAGARDPDARQAGPGRERFVGYTFMRANADQYQRVFGAARLVGLVFSLILGVMIWRTARAWYGVEAGLASLALWVVMPEALAHGATAGVDIPTALAFFGVAVAWTVFLRRGDWRSWWVVAAWTGAAFLTRFSAGPIFPALLIVTAFAAWRGDAAAPRRAWLGLLLLPLVAWMALDVGYLFKISWQPLGSWTFQSDSFHTLQRTLPWVRLPLPEAWLQGLDYLGSLSQPGAKQSFLLGQIHDRHSWLYFPTAIAVKWPLGLIGLAALQKWGRWREWRTRKLSLEDVTLLAFMAVVLLTCMATNLDYGVRYALPVLPLLCVWCSDRVRTGRGRGRSSAIVAALVATVALESARALPYPLAFFNAIAGGPGRGDHIVNDSNVDWGQGLVALHRDLARLGVGKVLLAYHGTVDPALYGIDYEPYLGANPELQSDWLAVSSYFVVGLPARVTTSRGMSEQALAYDFSQLKDRAPAARPAHCMYLFRIR